MRKNRVTSWVVSPLIKEIPDVDRYTDKKEEKKKQTQEVYPVTKSPKGVGTLEVPSRGK